jgi:Kdo2-lipid IVA lauroyltransferase/acyltransferase
MEPSTQPSRPPNPRERIEYLGVVGAARLAARMPRGLFTPLARAIGYGVYHLDARGRAVSHANLKCAFGDTMSPQRRSQVARASYATFAKTMMELFWRGTSDRAITSKLVEVTGNTEADGDPHRPAIYPTMHFSNFEWVGLLGRYVVGPVPLVAQQFRNPLIGPVFDAARRATGQTVIPRERAMLRMLKHLRNGGAFGMLCDLSLDPREGSVAITQFGGLATSVTQMHAALAVRTGARVVPVEMRPLPGDRYRMTFHPEIPCSPEIPAAHVVQQTWNVLEQAIHSHPECWIWSYKHWRYRPSDADPASYPFYANTAPRFDRICQRDLSNT